MDGHGRREKNVSLNFGVGLASYPVPPASPISVPLQAYPVMGPDARQPYDLLEQNIRIFF